MSHRLYVIAIAGLIICYGLYLVLAGSGGPPAKQDLRRVDGAIDKVVIQIKNNVLGQEERRHTVIHLRDGLGSFKYYDEQPGAGSLETYVPGEPVSLLVDDRFAIAHGQFEIWELKRGDTLLSSYESNLRNADGDSVYTVIGIVIILVGGLVLKNNL